MESSWRPATAEESFEIVRRRLFRPIESDNIPNRDATARLFGDLYRKEAMEFPPECREPAYVERIKAAYPIHPEVFTRLYEDWSTLERFQRTRGVLRLMAAVIHALWEAGDQAPLILPSSIPLAQASVAAELTRNLEDSWKPIIDADIDGPNSLPVALDRELAGTLGKFQAARRVARCIFLGSAPTLRSPNRGIDAARVRLGCVLPGETIATFGDALNRLSGRATFLYVDAGRYWFGVQPSVSRIARDRAERYLSEARDDIRDEIVRRLRQAQREPGEFRGVHPAPQSSSEVPDDTQVRLVILGPDRPHIGRSDDSPALSAATEILDRRGPNPREFRNMLVFLAADNRRLEELERGVADYLAWASVNREAGAEGLNLDPNQAQQAATKKADSDAAVDLRLMESYQWALIPTQPKPTAPATWDKIRVEGQGGLAERTARKLVNEAHIYVTFAPTLLRQRLDGELATLLESGDVSVGVLWEAFARYLYLPRLRDIQVLLASVASGGASTVWAAEGFATAEARDGERFLGLTVGHVTPSPNTLVVRADVASLQFEADAKATQSSGSENMSAPQTAIGIQPRPGQVGPEAPARPLLFYGEIDLEPERANRDFGRIVSEVIQHLTSLVGSDVRVTVEISATHPDGFPDATVRNVTENAKTLKFRVFGFEDR